MLLHNDRWAEGIATSLQVGGAAARPTAGHDAVVVGLGDQPGVTGGGLAGGGGAPAEPPIAVATYDGRRGNPVRLAAAVWPLLPDDRRRGRPRADAREARPGAEVPCTGQARDVDTVEDLERWS